MIPGCTQLAKDTGTASKYVRDCHIRAVRGLPYEDAAALLEYTGSPPIVIKAGIGTLVLGPGYEDFNPAPTLGQMALGALSALQDLTPASPEEVERRLDTCASCPLWRAGTGTCGACGCFTKAKAHLAAQACPKGHW